MFAHGKIPITALLALTMAAALPARAEIVAREGDGWLERREGCLILHVSGTPYEMGYQHGSLLRPLVQKNLRNIINNRGAKGEILAYRIYLALRDGMHARLVKHIPGRFIEEMRGLADGAQMGFNEILAGNLFPEAFHCSGIALMGGATDGGDLHHVRILDFMTDMALQETAVVVMASPESGNAFMNVAFAGFMGSVTGMNEKQVAIGEMGGLGQFYWDGLPMSLLIRDALERADTLDEALDIFQMAPRTCEYYYVISDGKIPDARALYATPKQLKIVKPGESYALFDLPPAPADDSGLGKIILQGFESEQSNWQTVLRDPNGRMLAMMNRQPEDTVIVSGQDRFAAFADRLEERYGEVNVENLIGMISRPVSMKSNLHNVIFKPSSLEAWIAVAGADGTPACDMPYARVQLKPKAKTAASR